MKPQHLFSLTILALAALFAANSASAQITPFSSDFKGKRQWNWDSRNELGNGNKSKIGGKDVFTISPDSYAAGDGVFIERDVTNPDTQYEQGSFTIAFQVNPWDLQTQESSDMRIVGVKTQSGNKGAFNGGGIMRVSLSRANDPNQNNARIRSQATSVFGEDASITHIIEHNAADRDGFIDVEINVDVTGYGSTWSLDWTQSTLYAGKQLTDSSNYTQTSWPSTGLKEVIAYQLGLLSLEGEKPTGSITFDNFHVFDESDRGAYVDIPEPRTYAIFFGITAGFMALCRRRRT